MADVKIDGEKQVENARYPIEQHEKVPQAHDHDAVKVVENPLQLLSRVDVVRDVEAFVDEKGLSEHKALFERAALVARDPTGFEGIHELTPEEREALAYERDHKWANSFQLYYAITICALGAATQGWDQTGSNGANLSFPAEFGINAPLGSPNGLRDEWIVGAVNAVIFLSAGVVGCWISDPLNNLLGRRGEIFFTSAILIATPIASGFTHSWQQLFAVRFIMGIGVGAKNATVPIFSAEMAPARIRGALVMGWQLWVTFGIFLGFAANVIVKDTGAIAWRLQLGSAFIPAFPLFCGIWFAPESPRWLMKHNNYPKAFRSYLRLRKHEIIAARDLYYSHVLYMEEIKEARGANYFSRLWDCFRVPRIRRANLAGSTIMLAQQMCGINKGGASATNALYASLGFGAINFVFAIPAVWLIDSFGRRSLLLSTFPFMAVFVLAAGLAFLIPTEGSVKTGVIALFIYLFTVFYSVGEGPVCFMYSAEIFPNVQREQGMAFTVAINNFFAGVLSLTFPPMRRAMTATGAFAFYAGLNLIAFFMIFLWCPETKQLTLEELDQVFSIPTKVYMKHEVTKWLPYMFKKYVLFQRHAQPPIPILAKAQAFVDH
ncbi:hypothetical protein CI109_100729 [Kwoniella shandongensis]|uniref:Major facilitator superfamily (MFS) profile domain-containing protein n=1 Tax=Kwoniella shandongensis TaxID=1734106 RepID=A0AAJ8LC63_9TREE